MRDDEIRRLLGQNAAHTARAVAHGDKVRQSASEALDGLQRRLAAASPGELLLDEAKATDYRRSVGDAGRLASMLGSTGGG